VQGKRQFEITEGIFEPAANMLSMSLDAFVAKPDSNFIDADDQSLCTLCDGNRVAHMIAMSVADEDKVRLHSIGRDRRGRIPIQEWVNDEFVSIRFKSKSSVSVPGQFRGHKNLLFHLV
jgi:hypothetical protein